MGLSNIFFKGREHKIKLLKGERVREKLTPHFLAFYGLYLIWIIMIVLSIVFIVYSDELSDIFRHPLGAVVGLLQPFSGGSNPITSGIPLLSNWNVLVSSIIGSSVYTLTSKEYLPTILWLMLLFSFSMVISVLRIEWKWPVIMVGTGSLSLAITLALGLPGYATYYIAIGFSILGMFGVEIYRKSHVFYITNYRIITSLRFLGTKENALSYDKINNVVLEQSLFGKIFNFGTLIPITASGLGMGEDMAAVTLGIAGQRGKGTIIGGAITGGRTVGVPRTRSAYALFGISNPREIYNIVSQFVQEYIEAPYLKEMTKELRAIKREIRDDNEEPEGRAEFSKEDPVT